MPLVRLAKLSDYEPVQMLGSTMYRISWDDRLCPGNPTEDPVEGLALYNDFQCAVALGRPQQTNADEKLQEIIHWCLNCPNKEMAALLAGEMVRAYKDSSFCIGLEVDQKLFIEPALSFRYELAFLNSRVKKLSASTVMKLQNCIVE